jgi:hypothetical protein
MSAEGAPADESAARIVYRLRESDLEAFADHACRHMPALRTAIRRQRIVMAVAVALLAAVVAFAPPLVAIPSEGTAMVAVLLAVGAIIAFLVLPSYHRRLIRRATLRRSIDGTTRRELFSTQTLEAREDGLHVNNDVVDGLYRWCGIEGFFVADEHFYISRSQYSNFIVPRAGIESGDFNAFADACHRHHAGATAIAHPPTSG